MPEYEEKYSYHGWIIAYVGSELAGWDDSVESIYDDGDRTYGHHFLGRTDFRPKTRPSGQACFTRGNGLMRMVKHFLKTNEKRVKLATEVHHWGRRSRVGDYHKESTAAFGKGFGPSGIEDPRSHRDCFLSFWRDVQAVKVVG